MTHLGIAVAIGVFVASAALAWTWSERTVRRLFLRWGRNEPRRTALLVVISHLAWLVVAVVVVRIQQSATLGGPPPTTVGLALAALLVVLGAYTLPWFARWGSDFQDNCAGFVAEGATPATARAFYLSGLLFSYAAIFVGVTAIVSWFPA